MDYRNTSLKPLRVKVDMLEVEQIMILTPRSGTVLDLKREIERTFQKLLPPESVCPIHDIRKDNGRVLLPSWYPIEPLLKDNEVVVLGLEPLGSESELDFHSNARISKELMFRDRHSSFDVSDSSTQYKLKSPDMLLKNISKLPGFARYCSNDVSAAEAFIDTTPNSKTANSVPNSASQAQGQDVSNNAETARIRKRKVLSPDSTVADNNHAKAVKSTSVQSNHYIESKDKSASPAKDEKRRKVNDSKVMHLKFYKGKDLLTKGLEATGNSSEVMSDALESPLLEDTVILSRSTSGKAHSDSHVVPCSTQIETGFEIVSSELNEIGKSLVANETTQYGVSHGDQNLFENQKDISKQVENFEDGTVILDNREIKDQGIIPKTNNGDFEKEKRMEEEISDHVDKSFSLFLEDVNANEIERMRNENPMIVDDEKEVDGLTRVDIEHNIEQREPSNFSIDSDGKKAGNAKESVVEAVNGVPNEVTESTKSKTSLDPVKQALNDEIQNEEFEKNNCVEKRHKKKKNKERINEHDITKDTMETTFGSESTIFEIKNKDKVDLEDKAGIECTLGKNNCDALQNGSILHKGVADDLTDDVSSQQFEKKIKKKKKKRKKTDAMEGTSNDSQSFANSTVYTEEESIKSINKKKKKKARKEKNDYEKIAMDVNVAEQENSAKKAASKDNIFKVPKAKSGKHAPKIVLKEELSSALEEGNTSFSKEGDKQLLVLSEESNMVNERSGCDGVTLELLEKSDYMPFGKAIEQKLCFDDDTDVEISAIQSNIDRVCNDIVHESDNSHSILSLPLDLRKKTRRSKTKRKGSKFSESPRKIDVDAGKGTKKGKTTIDTDALKGESATISAADASLSTEKHELLVNEPSLKPGAKRDQPTPNSKHESKPVEKEGHKKKKIKMQNITKPPSNVSSSDETSSISFSDMSAEVVSKKQKTVPRSSSQNSQKQEVPKDKSSGKEIVKGDEDGKENTKTTANVDNIKTGKSRKEKRDRKKSKSSRRSSIDASVTKVHAWLSQISDETVENDLVAVDGRAQEVASQEVAHSTNEASFSVIEATDTDHMVNEEKGEKQKNIKGSSKHLQSSQKTYQNNRKNVGKHDNVDAERSACEDHNDNNKTASVDNGKSANECKAADEAVGGTVVNGKKNQNESTCENSGKRKKGNKFKKKNFILPSSTPDKDGEGNSRKIQEDLNASLEKSDLRFDSLLDDGGSIVSSKLIITKTVPSPTSCFVQKSINGFLTSADRKRFLSKVKQKKE